MDVVTDLDEVKKLLDTLHSKVQSASRLTKDEKLAVLARVYSIKLTTQDTEKLIKYITEVRQGEGANRAFVFKKNDNPYILPLRYIFPRTADRSSVSRYAGALNQLRKMGVETSKTLETIRKSGGVQELYWQSRQKSGRVQRRAKINLNRMIEYESGKELTLRLMPRTNGCFDVLESSQ